MINNTCGLELSVANLLVISWRRFFIYWVGVWLVGIFALGADEVLINPVTGKPVPYAGRFDMHRTIPLPTYRPRATEMRGVWVATIENIDFGKHTDAESFRQDFITVVENLRRANFNAIFFQIRPMCDAFYPSKFNPWSRWLTGKEGDGIPNFDPLTFMVIEAQKRGLEFHAWLNPYRVNARAITGKATYLNTLDPKSFARQNPDLVLESRLSNGNYSLFLNPGEPRVIAHISETITEILENYPVDAIHFDDYFYLYTDIGNIDQASYLRNNPDRLSLADWRRANVDKAICTVKKRIQAFNQQTGRKVAFGVSPFGIWANQKSNPNGSLTGGKQSYYEQYADTRGWVKKGWVDYIIPQLYWPLSHDVAAYAALADWWSDVVNGTRVRLFIGHGIYRLGSSQNWYARELGDQICYNQRLFNVDGSVLFSYRCIFTPSNAQMKEATSQLLKLYWCHPARTPGYPNVR